MARLVRRLTVLLAVFAVGLAACGGDDGGAEQGASSGACPDGARERHPSIRLECGYSFSMVIVVALIGSPLPLSSNDTLT